MKDFYHCCMCNGIIEAGGCSSCVCSEDYENECEIADDCHGIEGDESNVE